MISHTIGAILIKFGLAPTILKILSLEFFFIFLKTFGLKNLEDLPKLREIEDIASDESPVNSHIEVTIDVRNSADAESLQEKIDEEFGISDNDIKPDDLDINTVELPENLKSENSENEDNLSSQEFIITHEEAEKNFF